MCTPRPSSITTRQLAGRSHSTWAVSNFSSLVAFGDSYTDENRLNYFGIHNGSAPPAGTFLLESFSTAGSGWTWLRRVIQYTGAEVRGKWEPSMTLYDYAVSGAVYSSFITPRYVVQKKQK
jgi:phospholipase/lecithinase/hemolysin